MMSQCVCSADQRGWRGGCDAHERALHRHAPPEPGLNNRCCFQRTRDNRQRKGWREVVMGGVMVWLTPSSASIPLHACAWLWAPYILRCSRIKTRELLTRYRNRVDLSSMDQYSEELHFHLLLLLLLVTSWPDGRRVQSGQNLKGTGSRNCRETPPHLWRKKGKARTAAEGLDYGSLSKTFMKCI